MRRVIACQWPDCRGKSYAKLPPTVTWINCPVCERPMPTRPKIEDGNTTTRRIDNPTAR